ARNKGGRRGERIKGGREIAMKAKAKRARKCGYCAEKTNKHTQLCMWHIMQKVPAKICPEIYDETDFKERFGKLVWNMFMEPLEFEEKWSKLVEDFGLQNHKWMRKMFDLRHMWLLGYFIQSPLFGLMRTTSRSESENAFFRNFTNHRSTLVMRNPEDGSVECTCGHFLRYGFLCRHVFCVLKNCNIEIILERYILRRWRRDLIPPALRRNKNRYEEKDEAIEKLTNETNFVVDECLFLLRKDKEQLKRFVENLENIKKEIQVKVPNPPSQKTGDVIEDIYAIKKLKQNLVNNPQKARNKGGRRGERINGGREITMKAKAIRAWKCGYCAEKKNKHTKTTCPLNPKYIVKLATIETAVEQERRTTTSATEKEERNSDSTHIADKEQSNTAS
nr:hypothetical protein [Tanacetum cinerariifolium]